MKKYCELKNEERHINMKIEQQNPIKEFLNEEFGVDKGQEVFNKQEIKALIYGKNGKSTMLLFPL